MISDSAVLRDRIGRALDAIAGIEDDPIVLAIARDRVCTVQPQVAFHDLTAPELVAWAAILAIVHGRQPTGDAVGELSDLIAEVRRTQLRSVPPGF